MFEGPIIVLRSNPSAALPTHPASRPLQSTAGKPKVQSCFFLVSVNFPFLCNLVLHNFLNPQLSVSLYIPKCPYIPRKTASSSFYRKSGPFSDPPNCQRNLQTRPLIYTQSSRCSSYTSPHITLGDLAFRSLIPKPKP